MAARFELVAGAMPTSGTADYVISGFDAVKGAIVFSSGGLVDGSISDHARWGVGFVDDANQGAISMVAQDAVATSNANRSHSDVDAVVLASAGGDQLLAAQLSATIITDGIRLTANDPPANAYLITVLLIGGDDVLNVDMITFDDLGSSVGPKTVTMNKSFTPNLLFAATMGASALPPEAEVFGFSSFGVSNFAKNRMVAWAANDNAAADGPTAYVGSNDCMGQCLAGSAATQWLGYAQNPSEGSFELYTRQSTGTDIGFFLAIELNSGYAASIHDVALPTSGNAVISTPGVNPACIIDMLFEGITARDSAQYDFNGAVSTIIANAAAVNVVSAGMDDNINKVSNWADSLVGINGAGTAAGYAGSTALADGGYTHTLTTNPAVNPILGWGFAVGPSAGKKLPIRQILKSFPRQIRRGIRRR